MSIENTLYEDTLVKIDFDEFDEVVLNGREIKATKSNSNFDSTDDLDIDLDDVEINDFEPDNSNIGVEVTNENIPATSSEDIQQLEDEEINECSTSKVTEDEEINECAGSMTDEEIKAEIEGKGKGVTEGAGSMYPDEYAAELEKIKKHNNDQDAGEEIQVNGDINSDYRSLADLYESRKNMQRNKLVESLLVDNTVDSIETILKQTLHAHGISKAESVVTIGLILDRLLNATDEDVAAPEFLDSVINQLVNNKDINSLVKKAVENALEGKEPLPAPGLCDVDDVVNVIVADDEKPQTYGDKVEKKDEPEKE